MDSAVTDIFGSGRTGYDRMMPAMGGAPDPAFSMLLDQTAARNESARTENDDTEADDADTGTAEGEERPDRSGEATQSDPATVGKKKTSGVASTAMTGAEGTNEAARPITVEAAQVRFATAEDALPIPTGEQDAVVQSIAAGNPTTALAGAANASAQAGKASDTLKSAEEFVLGRRAHLLDANAAHADQARVALTKGKGANAGAGKGEAGAAGNGASATSGAKGAAADASAAQVARSGAEATPAGSDRPATSGSQAQTASAPTPAPATSAAANPALAAANAAPTFADTMRANMSARGDAGTTALDPGAAAGTERQPAQAAVAAKSAAARPGPAMPQPRPAEQLSLQIRHAAVNGNERISVKLTPASLGHVEVKLELAPDKTVHAVVTADRPETLDMLERDARVLQRALEDAGLKTGSDSLSFAHRDSGQATADGNRSSGSGPAAPQGDTADEQIVLADQPAQSRRAHDGVLDLEI